MKVLLIQPKLTEIRGSSWMPIGLVNIASYLRSNDISVKIIDNSVFDYSDKFIKKQIEKFQPDIVGIGAMTVQVNDAIRLGKLVKSTSNRITLVYGGVHFTFKPNDGLIVGDIIVRGEGEQTFLEICKGKTLENIDGITYKDDGEIKNTKNRELIKNLDILPFPAYDLLPMGLYNDDRFVSGKRAISIMSGRGCPFNCVFCAGPNMWKRKVRFHSVQYMEDHISLLVEKYKLRNLRLVDDVFTVNKNRVFEFCDMIKKKNFKLDMNCITHIKTCDFEMFKSMNEAGFSEIIFGIESGSEHIQKLVNKNFTLKEIKETVEMAKKAGLNTSLLFMVGNIGETEQTVLESKKLIKELKELDKVYHTQTYVHAQFAQPIMGSKFNEIAKQFGRVGNEIQGEIPFIPNGLTEKKMTELLELIKDMKALQPSKLGQSIWDLSRSLFGDHYGSIIAYKLAVVKEEVIKRKVM